MALQKVAIAKACESGDKTTLTRNRMQVLSLFCPNLFFPSVLIGILVDLLIFSSIKTFSKIGIAVGVFLILTGFIATLLTIAFVLVV